MPPPISHALTARPAPAPAAELSAAWTEPEVSVGSAVEVDIRGVPHYGVIRWLGHVRGDSKRRLLAGVEMVRPRRRVASDVIGRGLTSSVGGVGRWVRAGFVCEGKADGRCAASCFAGSRFLLCA